MVVEHLHRLSFRLAEGLFYFPSQEFPPEGIAKVSQGVFPGLLLHLFVSVLFLESFLQAIDPSFIYEQIAYFLTASAFSSLLRLLFVSDRHCCLWTNKARGGEVKPVGQLVPLG